MLQQFLAVCRSFADAFNLPTSEDRNRDGFIGANGHLPAGTSLFRPVKTYVTDFVRGLLLGAGPRHLACAVAGAVRQSSAQGF